jgi:hypothetical protein
MARDRRKNFRLEWNCLARIHDSQRNLARPCILSSFSNGGAQITGMRAKRPRHRIYKPGDARKRTETGAQHAGGRRADSPPAFGTDLCPRGARQNLNGDSIPAPFTSGTRPVFVRLSGGRRDGDSALGVNSFRVKSKLPVKALLTLSKHVSQRNWIRGNGLRGTGSTSWDMMGAV